MRNLDHELTGGAKLPEEQLKKVINLCIVYGPSNRSSAADVPFEGP